MILDIPRKLKNNKIFLPSFHTGHTGMLSDVEIYAYYDQTESRTEHKVCNLIFSSLPLDKPQKSLIEIECVVADQPGAVESFFRAISMLGINIVDQNSSVNLDEGYHDIYVIVDITQVVDIPHCDIEKAKQYYQKFVRQECLTSPVKIALTESIIAHCKDILDFEKSNGDAQLNLYMRDINLPQLTQDTRIQPSDMRKIKTRKYCKNITFHKNLINWIKHEIDSDELYYLVRSFGQTKSVNVRFFGQEEMEKTAHVMFEHADLPGALENIVGAIAKTDSNIVNSFLRRETRTKSTWTATVTSPQKINFSTHKETNSSEKREYDGKDIENKKSSIKTAHFIRELIEKKARTKILDLNKYGTKISPPNYPYSVEDGDKLDFTGRKNPQPPIKKTSSQLNQSELREKLSLITLSDTDSSQQWKNNNNGHLTGRKKSSKHANKLINLLKDRVNKSETSVFISYNFTHGKEHYEIIKDLLWKELGLEACQGTVQRDGHCFITNGVIDKIRHSDYFIGIWQSQDSSGEIISPWMPYEYGVAAALNKPRLLMTDERLDNSITSRIDKEIAQVKFQDVTFTKNVEDQLLQQARDTFIKDDINDYFGLWTKHHSYN